MAAHDVNELKVHCACPDTYKEILIPEKRTLHGLEKLCGNGRMACAYGGREIRTAKGSFRSGDMLAFQQNGQWCALKAELFMEFVSFAGDCHFLVVGHLLSRVQQLIFRTDEVRPTFLHLDTCQMHFPYLELGGNLIMLVLPFALYDRRMDEL